MFKVIDNQEQVEKGAGSGFHWENPKARKVLKDPTSHLGAEIVKEFLEFYSLDYTKNIYCPEVNIRPENEMKRDEITKKAGLKAEVKDKPLLVQLLENYLAGSRAQDEPVNTKKKAPEHSFEENQPAQHIDRAKELLRDVQREEEKGFALGSSQKK